MPTLRLTQTTVRPNRYRVEAALETARGSRQIASSEFDYELSAQDGEDLRWYLEDYLQHVADPAPKIAARIEARISTLGTTLFKAVFEANDDARDLWSRLRDELNDTRVEIITGVREATALPWELLRDPRTDVPLALRARAFVHAAHRSAQRPHLPDGDSGPVRVLLVICRPGGGDDVPFRSVASRLIKGLTENSRQTFELDVLRPPTFARLADVLRDAKQREKPYHIVHFDGHGTYEGVESAADLDAVRRELSPMLLSAMRSGAHGYLLFENPSVEQNLQLVDGPSLGKLLAETDVPTLVLNACRSAHAEAPAEPEEGTEDVHAPIDCQQTSLRLP